MKLNYNYILILQILTQTAKTVIFNYIYVYVYHFDLICLSTVVPIFPSWNFHGKGIKQLSIVLKILIL